MFDFKDKDSKTYSTISAACVFLLVVMFGYLLFAPKPTYKRSAAKQGRMEMTLKLSAQKAQERKAAAEKTINNRTWEGTAEKLTPIALAQVNTYVAKTGVNLLAFRPQRPVIGKKLESIPYLVSVEGEYPKVMKFFRTLDKDNQKLAVSLIQVSSADNASDRVTGSAGLLAYVKVLPAPSEPETKTATPTANAKPTLAGEKQNGE